MIPIMIRSHLEPDEQDSALEGCAKRLVDIWTDGPRHGGEFNLIVGGCDSIVKEMEEILQATYEGRERLREAARQLDKFRVRPFQCPNDKVYRKN